MKINNLDELIGKRVVSTADFGTLGYLITDRHLQARRIGAVGTVQGWVPGHGGDIVYVLQEDTPIGEEPVAVYNYLNELEFYSEEVMIFAKTKVRMVDNLSKWLKELKEEKFS